MLKEPPHRARKKAKLLSVALASLTMAAFMAPPAWAETNFLGWAPTPTMGWNSWDFYGTSVDETSFKAQVDYMASNLLQYGWDMATVDIEWFRTDPTGFGYDWDGNLSHNMDGYGRLLPAVNRFPSASGTNGFRPLADYVHSKGIRFGIHIMRGIARNAWDADTPVLGTPYTARDIADTGSWCDWNPDMWGVDMSQPGAQEYYNSLFDLYAEWGVDFVKVDDISRPYDSVQQAEIEAIRAAIDQCGRPMVLSLSPGETPLYKGSHVMTNANQWRVSDDFWDNWPALYDQFQRLHDWTPYRGPGYFPDADMLPLGKVDGGYPGASGRWTGFTMDEQYTLMNMWCIARSPLIHGGDMTQMDPFTLSLMTNPEVLAVNQHSSNNQQLFRTADLVAWMADAPGGGKYLALFNLNDAAGGFDALWSQASYASDLITDSTPGRSTPINVDITGKDRLYLLVDSGDGPGPDPDVYDYDWADWVNMELQGPGGNIPLTSLSWISATSGWMGPEIDQNNEGSGPLVVDGVVYANGIGTHARSIIEYELPAGYTNLTGFGGLDDGGVTQPGSTTSVRFGITTLEDGLGVETNEVNLADLGFSGEVVVRDLWERADIGTFAGTFSAPLAAHASELYLIHDFVPPSISSIQYAPSNGVEITWNSLSSKTYRVSCTGDLTNDWSSLTPDVTATGTSSSYIDTTVSNETARFYRVEHVME